MCRSAARSTMRCRFSASAVGPCAYQCTFSDIVVGGPLCSLGSRLASSTNVSRAAPWKRVVSRGVYCLTLISGLGMDTCMPGWGALGAAMGDDPRLDRCARNSGRVRQVEQDDAPLVEPALRDAPVGLDVLVDPVGAQHDEL